ncbi:unnamed protein product [Thlaspi arvense]|uniref:glutathione transferase n=1 Tax=Thlaspi arvense TaxID=13288 RepID=A0AAU9RLB8_THLAR|nr:unnamed protein product [Thlaspi arvense]
MAYSGEVKEKLKLYSYWRSSCGHRVRLALSLKGIEYEYIPVNLLKGDQFNPDFMKINPMGTVPALVDGDVVISDSFAIIMYIDEKYPEPPLLPRDLHKRALNYQAASIISSGIQPYQNLPVIRYIEEKTNAEEKIVWINNVIRKGFTALEKLLVNCAGKYATGDEIYLADLFLATQIHGAMIKFQIDVEPYPILAKCYEAYNELSVFQDAIPAKQPDAPSPAKLILSSSSLHFRANSGSEKKEKLKLYSYWRSSCVHRVRIALDLKGLEYEYIPVNLRKRDQLDPGFKKINPMGTVPALVDGGVVISDSFAIIMYLDERYPEPPLLPRDLHKRAVNYQAASIVLSGIQPHQNLAVMRLMEEKISDEEKTVWVSNAITKGFTALEELLVSSAGKYATGDEVYLADVFLAPQIHTAVNRFQINMEPYPTLVKCYESYNDLPVFQNAVPEKQPDAPASTS